MTTLTPERLRELVFGAIESEVGVDADRVVLSASLVDDLGADSLDLVELMMELEEEFGIEIPDEDVDGWRTAGDVLAYVRQRLAK